MKVLRGASGRVNSVGRILSPLCLSQRHDAGATVTTNDNEVALRMKATNDSPERMKETLSQANSLSHHSNIQPLPPLICLCHCLYVSIILIQS